MYYIFSVVGFVIRQFYLPNPFAPLGTNADGINLLFGGLLVPISYVMTGMIYQKGSEPAIGSILFFLVYMVNTGATYLVCLAHPTVWLMIVISVAYLASYLFLAYKIRTAQ